MTGNLIEVDNDNFQKEVLESDLPVLVDFWAEWCRPCKVMEPSLIEISNEYENRLKVCKINMEKGDRIVSRYKVRGLPSILIFSKGEQKSNQVGLRSKKEVKKEIERVLKDESD